MWFFLLLSVHLFSVPMRLESIAISTSEMDSSYGEMSRGLCALKAKTKRKMPGSGLETNGLDIEPPACAE